MTTSALATEAAAAKTVKVTDRTLVVELQDGRVVSVLSAGIHASRPARGLSAADGNWWVLGLAFTGRRSTRTFLFKVFSTASARVRVASR